MHSNTGRGSVSGGPGAAFCESCDLDKLAHENADIGVVRNSNHFAFYRISRNHVGIAGRKPRGKKRFQIEERIIQKSRPDYVDAVDVDRVFLVELVLYSSQLLRGRFRRRQVLHPDTGVFLELAQIRFRQYASPGLVMRPLRVHEGDGQWFRFCFGLCMTASRGVNEGEKDQSDPKTPAQTSRKLQIRRGHENSAALWLFTP